MVIACKRLDFRCRAEDTKLGRMETVGLVMAGGRSERMRAGGSPQHKSLRTVQGAPLIEWNLRLLLDAQAERIFVAVAEREQELRTWLSSRGRALCPSLTILVESAPLGTIGAAGLLPVDVDEALVVNVDNLSTLDLRELLQTHRSARAAATIASHAHPFRLPFGMLQLDGDRVAAYREKPELPIVISSGTYALNRRAIARIEPGVRTDVPALIDALLHAGDIVAAHRHAAPWIDVNDEQALAQAGALFASRAPS